MKNRIKSKLILLAVLTLNACAFVPQQATLQPEVNVSGSDVGNGADVMVTVFDERPDKSLGHRGTAYGKAAKITTEQDVAQVFRDNIVSGLSAKGFRPLTHSDNEMDKRLHIELRLLEYSTSSGFFTGGIHAKATIKAIATSNNERYEKIYRVNDEKRVLIVPTAGKNESLINQSISGVLEKMFQDDKLLAILAKQDETSPLVSNAR